MKKKETSRKENVLQMIKCIRDDDIKEWSMLYGFIKGLIEVKAMRNENNR